MIWNFGRAQDQHLKSVFLRITYSLNYLLLFVCTVYVNFKYLSTLCKFMHKLYLFHYYRILFSGMLQFENRIKLMTLQVATLHKVKSPFIGVTIEKQWWLPTAWTLLGNSPLRSAIIGWTERLPKCLQVYETFIPSSYSTSTIRLVNLEGIDNH